MKQIVKDFLQQIQPSYPEKLSVEYKREGQEAIPLKMADKYESSIPLEAAVNETIVLMSKTDSEKMEMADQGAK